MCPSEYETLLVCHQCGARQYPSEVKVVEIVEPGKNPRTEYHGKIRGRYCTDTYHHSPRTQPVRRSWMEYTCLVCGHVWGAPPEDPTPGGASVTFLHPITEHDEECDGDCLDRDCC